MKRTALILFLIIMAACTAATAQKLTVVVGAVGEEPKPGLRKALETQIKAAFVKDGRYTAVTREEAVLGAVDSEQAHQRTGAVDDNQIKQIGKQTGARYVCVVEIAPLMNSYTLNAQFVDIVSANIVSIASVPSQLRNPGDFLKASEELVRKLLGYAEAPATTQKVKVSHIAVIETRIDERSDLKKEISGADLGEITSVLRREAVKNLPRDRYNVMTSETVQSMGTATLQDCSDENCIITIGSKIGADYVVRGTLSKVRDRLSLTVEIFETEYGNLVEVTPAPIRTTDFYELLDKSEVGCAAMYRSFAGTNQMARPQTTTASEPKPKPAAPAPTSSDVRYSGRQTPAASGGVNYYGSHAKQIGVKRYFSMRWLPPITPVTSNAFAFDLEYGKIRTSGWFWGIDAGMGNLDYAHFGFGFNLGKTHELPSSLQLAYGGFAGVWGHNGDYSYGYYGNESGDFDEAVGFIGPFIKLHWHFIEASYRGIIGMGYISQLMLGLHFRW